MLWLAVFGGLGFLVSLVLTPAVREVMIWLGVLDRPDKVRRFHDRAVPRLGGLAIFLSYAAVLADLNFFASLTGLPFTLDGTFSQLGVASVVLVFVIGLLDDLVGLRPWQKLGGQLAAAVVAYFGGIQIQSIQSLPLDIWWGLPLTVLWLVLCSNAFNLIDGMDGLATGIALFAAATTAVAGYIHGDMGLVMLTVPLCGVLLGFLRYNFNPASVFLGDGGSLTLGFLLGSFGVMWSHKSATLLGMTAPLIALGVPLLDVTVSIIRRFLRSHPIFMGDRGHLHHRLLDMGLTPRRAVFFLYAGCILAASLSLLESSNGEYSGVVVVLFCAAAALAVRELRYVEFSVASRILFRGHFRRFIAAELLQHQLEAELAKANTLTEWWDVVRDRYRDFGLFGVRLQLEKTLLESSPGDPSARQIRIPLGGKSYINFYSEFEADEQAATMWSFVRTVESSIHSKNLFRPAVASAAVEKAPAAEGISTPVAAIQKY